MLKKDNVLSISQLQERGWGSRLTIFRRVDRGELPKPFSYGKSHNSKKYWLKDEIDALEAKIVFGGE